MESKIAAEVRREQLARYAVMTPGERVALAAHLGEEGLASYMALHGVDRRTAISRIKQSHRLGRRHSPCASADEDR